jgi:hypothetical protein
MVGGGNKGEWWRGWIQIWYVWYIVRTFVNAIMYSSPAQKQCENMILNFPQKNNILLSPNLNQRQKL